MDTHNTPSRSFWAERLLGSSTSEGSGRRYEDSDLTRLAPSLGKGRVLLAHGTRDPAAHHAFLLAHALISSETYFTHVVCSSPRLASFSRCCLFSLPCSSGVNAR
ncbi:hypothetical protein E2C01_080540 [Portunus trituberculatus]|uniref:Uncharacterized protein n=1 Tax=Portunus trituberculatus TaxID=210409 RepID=A0A5B7IMH3_PORTR|nr:hypothetical protein [Portunus trituberculatus]